MKKVLSAHIVVALLSVTPTIEVAMMTTLFVLLLVGMFSTFFVMVAGIALMARGGEANMKYGNKLMQWRVLLQGVSLALLAVLFMMKGQG